MLVVGSLLFIGSFKYRPVKALPEASNSSSSAGFEEKIDAQKGKDEDEELYLKILEKSPRDVEALKVVLYGKMRKGKTKEAVKYVERLIDIQPGEVEWRLLQALSYELMGQLTKAKRLFKEILKDRPLLLRALHVCTLTSPLSFYCFFFCFSPSSGKINIRIYAFFSSYVHRYICGSRIFGFVIVICDEITNIEIYVFKQIYKFIYGYFFLFLFSEWFVIILLLSHKTEI